MKRPAPLQPRGGKREAPGAIAASSTTTSLAPGRTRRWHSFACVWTRCRTHEQRGFSRQGRFRSAWSVPLPPRQECPGFGQRRQQASPLTTLLPAHLDVLCFQWCSCAAGHSAHREWINQMCTVDVFRPMFANVFCFCARQCEGRTQEQKTSCPPCGEHVVFSAPTAPRAFIISSCAP